MLRYMDATIGQWDRTVFISLSDNGWMKKVTPDVKLVGCNGPLRGGKYELYESGIRVPRIFRGPGLRPLIAGKTGNAKRTLFWRFTDLFVGTILCYTARQGRWKRLDDELLDLAADPGERHPICSNRLRKELETFIAEVR